MLRSVGRKQGRDAVLKSLRAQAQVQPESVFLVGASSAANKGDVQHQRSDHRNSKKILAQTVQSFTEAPVTAQASVLKVGKIWRHPFNESLAKRNLSKES